MTSETTTDAAAATDAEKKPDAALAMLNRFDAIDAENRQLAYIAAHSRYFADGNAALGYSQALMKIQAGRELGLSPTAALMGLYFVNGRVALSAGVIGTLIKASGKYDYRVVSLTNDACTIEFFALTRRVDSATGEITERESLGVSSFDLKDAAAAGLTGRPGPWKMYPRNMLFARALTNGARWHTPDVFNGAVYATEETGTGKEEAAVTLDAEFTARSADAPHAAHTNGTQQ